MSSSTDQTRHPDDDTPGLQSGSSSSGSLLSRRAQRRTFSNEMTDSGDPQAMVAAPPLDLRIAVERTPVELRASQDAGGPAAFPGAPPTVARPGVAQTGGRPPRSPVPGGMPAPTGFRIAEVDRATFAEGAPPPPSSPPPTDALAPLSTVQPSVAPRPDASTAAPTAGDRRGAGPRSVTFSPDVAHARSVTQTFEADAAAGVAAQATGSVNAGSTVRTDVSAALSFSSALNARDTDPNRRAPAPRPTTTVSTQTAPLCDGYVARRGTHPLLPVMLLLTAPVVLLISGVSYGHYWRRVYATVAPTDTPLALSAYVACLFIGFVVENFLVFPLAVKIIASGMSDRSQQRHLLGASLLFSFAICIPLAVCELSLVNDSRANASKLGLGDAEPASTFTLLVLLTVGTFYVWMAYSNQMVNLLNRTVRKQAMKMLRSDGVVVLHQRPGTQTSSVTKLAMAQSSVKRSKLEARAHNAAIEMDTVSRRVEFSPE